MQRRSRTRGYFSGMRFGTRDGGEITDEIALNPACFRERTTEQILSTLVHEMTHLQQHHFGKPSRSGYHNKEWGRLMLAVGLVPSDTGKPGGRQVGQSVTHYIAENRPFAVACADLLRDGFDLLYVDLRDGERDRGKAASKTKYTCPVCDLNAWGKPDIH